MIADFRGKTVLVTGGTMGIGLATALAFGRRGARCTVTYRWGSADENEVQRRFADAGAPAPLVLEADASQSEATDRLLGEMRARQERVDVFVSNVSQAALVGGLGDYALRGLLKTLEYSTWPMVEYTRKIRQVFGHYPRYVVGMSSTGTDDFCVGYDLMAASKAVMETLCRYLSYRLFDEDVRINIVRTRNVRTASLQSAFGAEFDRFARRFTRERHFVEAHEVADVVVALCSGLLDGVRGQVITVDRGMSFFDNLMRLYDDREALGL